MSARASAKDIVLASGSRARREMLAAAGVPFTVRAADVDEPAIRARMYEIDPNVDPKKVAAVLAAAKAEDVGGKQPGALVIGADQVLALGDALLSKTPTIDAARAALQKLRGKTHELHSGIAVVRGGALAFGHVAVARMTMRAFSESFLDAYLDAAGANVTASVGAYQLERTGIHLFEKIEGDHFTILGLPLLPLLDYLRGEGSLAA